MYEFDGLHTVHDAGSVKIPGFRQRGKAPGDIVECGGNAGFLSSAILRYLNWPSVRKRFYLVDTFAGPLLEQYSPQEIERGRLHAARQAIASGGYVLNSKLSASCGSGSVRGAFVLLDDYERKS
jgi:hypothetical protein